MGRRGRQALATAGIGVLALLSVCAAGGCDSPAAHGSAQAVQRDSAGCVAQRPYGADSPWNTPIGPAPTTDPASASYLKTLTGTGTTLTSDVDQYTIAVYCVTDTTPRTSVSFSGYYSDYLTGTRVGHGYAPTIDNLPIPANLVPPVGSDAQIVIWDQAAGIEYGFWQFAWQNGRATATNGYAIRTDATSAGRFADGLAGRGAGLPYLGGLVRPDEIAAGHIDHALAFAYQFPAHSYVFPASKSDGKGVTGTDLPEGTRLQLDPTLTSSDLTAMGVSPAGLTIAKALQQYGMYVVDNSGSSKIYLEYRTTAGWDSSIYRTMLGNIPWNKFRVVQYAPSASSPTPSDTTSVTTSASPTTSATSSPSTTTSTSTPTTSTSTTSTSTSSPTTSTSATTVANMTFEAGSLTGSQGATLADGPVALETRSPLAGSASARFPKGTSAPYLEQRFSSATEHSVELTFRVNQLASGDTRIVQSLNATGSGTVTTGSFWLKADGTLLLRNYNTTIGQPGPKLAVGKQYRLRLHQRTNADGTILLEGFVAAPGQAFGAPFASATAAPASTKSVAVVRVGMMASNNSLDSTADDVRIRTGSGS